MKMTKEYMTMKGTTFLLKSPFHSPKVWCLCVKCEFHITFMREHGEYLVFSGCPELERGAKSRKAGSH